MAVASVFNKENKNLYFIEKEYLVYKKIWK